MSTRPPSFLHRHNINFPGASIFFYTDFNKVDKNNVWGVKSELAPPVGFEPPLGDVFASEFCVEYYVLVSQFGSTSRIGRMIPISQLFVHIVDAFNHPSNCGFVRVHGASKCSGG